MQKRVLKALALEYNDEVWKSLDTACREGGFWHDPYGGDDVDPVEWQEWCSGVVAYIANLAAATVRKEDNASVNVWC